jgi:NADH:ubiquinone oxidoreductase subunit C
MFGVNFLNHPDLRLLILPDGWEGKFPMRKDFEGPCEHDQTIGISIFRRLCDGWRFRI